MSVRLPFTMIKLMNQNLSPALLNEPPLINKCTTQQQQQRLLITLAQTCVFNKLYDVIECLHTIKCCVTLVFFSLSTCYRERATKTRDWSRDRAAKNVSFVL